MTEPSSNDRPATPLSGQQYELSAAGYVAVIASVGASLRRLRHDGRDLVVGFEADQVRPFFRGATLAPWPNRVVDGRYANLDGTDLQLALTEPARGHALHGLVGWHDFAATELGPDRVTLVAHLPAQDGYPHPISVEVAFVLAEDGLTTTVTGTNLGRSRAPWGTASHPYLVAGPGRVDDWTLELPAGQVLTVTQDRLIPLDLVDVADHETGIFDFRTARPIADTFVDHAFTRLARDDAGRAAVTVRADDAGVRMSFGAECGWVQIHTADQPDASISRLGLAVEPMTCAPDAYNAPGDASRGLILLGAGAAHSASWTIAAV